MPQETLARRVTGQTLEEDTQKLLLHGMQNLVSAPGEVMGIEGEGMH